MPKSASNLSTAQQECHIQCIVCTDHYMLAPFVLWQRRTRAAGLSVESRPSSFNSATSNLNDVANFRLGQVIDQKRLLSVLSHRQWAMVMGLLRCVNLYVPKTITGVGWDWNGPELQRVFWTWMRTVKYFKSLRSRLDRFLEMNRGVKSCGFLTLWIQDGN